jgi:arylsulfatase A-like enzyme
MRKLYIPVVLFALMACSCSQNNLRRSPNIVLINIDDMGWADVGYQGSEYYETPVIDELASLGMVFSQAYASASNCAPSRACLTSGQWTPRHGIYTVTNSDRGKSSDRMLVPIPNNTVLHDSVITLADVLQEAGYRTCHAGKWHLGPDPRTQGFDVNIGGSEAGHPGSYYPPYRNVPLEAPDSSYYLTNLVMDHVIDFLDSVGDNPFFLHYTPYAVHSPFHPVKSLLEKYQNKPPGEGQDDARYATMVENLDTQIGRLVSQLESSGKMKNTLLVFTTDNGGVYNISKQWPLRAGKGSYYEGGIRVPFFAVWPGKIKGGTISDVPVTNIDLFPTFLEAAKIKVPAGKILDGKSLLPLLQGNDNLPARALYWHFPIYLENGNPETLDPLFRTRPGSAIRVGDWKYIKYYEMGNEELYNLAEDPGEKDNLVLKNQRKAVELSVLLFAWLTNLEAPIPNQPNYEYVPPGFIMEE